MSALNPGIVPTGMSNAEWQCRCDTAAAYRLLPKYRLTDLSGGFIGGRTKEEPEHFLVKPYELYPEEVCASDLIKVDLDGHVAPGDDRAPNNAARNVCAALFSRRPEINGIVHIHTRASSAVASLEGGLLPVHQSALQFVGAVGYARFDYDLDETTCHSTLDELGAHKALLMRHHGLMTAGESLAEAFFLAYFLEQACDVQVATFSMGLPVVQMTEQAVARDVAKIRNTNHYDYDGADEWAAWLRMLERDGANYRC